MARLLIIAFFALRAMTATGAPTEEPNFNAPTEGLTEIPTKGPMEGLTKGQTERPIERPSVGPTKGPMEGPTKEPMEGPTKGPMEGPTERPTEGPIEGSTEGPTKGPTEGPTKGPMEGPTVGPTEGPTEASKPCLCDVCFETWKGAKRSCKGSFFQNFVCTANAFEAFARCWIHHCLIAIDGCAPRPFPDFTFVTDESEINESNEEDDLGSGFLPVLIG